MSPVVLGLTGSPLAEPMTGKIRPYIDLPSPSSFYPVCQMSNEKFVQRGVNAVMGVKDTAPENSTASKSEPSSGQRGMPTSVATYVGATLAQIAVMSGLLWLMDVAFQDFFMTLKLPAWGIPAIACAFFAFVTLRSRLFSLLDNTRNSGRYTSLRRPLWAPPPLAFPIVWMSIAVLRVVSSYLVWSAMGQTFFCWPLVLFVIHLSLGDTWNTIFTVEGRLGAAVPMVIFGPLLSVVAVTVSYYQTVPVAGWVIFPSAVWLAIATALCIRLWQLNGAASPHSATPEPQ